ncbi:MAG: PAS domain S-box protein [Deltaproteobacteria bacterium]|nr:PAS domain S-box protein [Deltaproteobacteria bacterium]
MKTESAENVHRDVTWRRSLATRFTWVTLIVVFSTLLALGGGLNYIARQALQEDVYRLQKKNAEMLAVFISSYISEVNDILQSFELTDFENEPKRPKHQANLDSFLIHHSSLFNRIAVLNDDGIETLVVSRFRTYLPHELKVRADHPGFQEASKGRTYIGPLYISPDSGLLSLEIAVPSHAGRYNMVMLAEVNATTLWQKISRLSIGRTGYAYIVDSKGRFVAYQELATVLQRYGEDMRGIPPVSAYLTEAAGDPIGVYEYQGLNHEPVIGLYKPIENTRWAVIVELPVQEAYQSVYRMQWYLVSVTIIGVLAACSLVFVVAKRLVCPIRALTRAARQIGAGDLDVEIIDIQRRDEVGVLAGVFRWMREELKSLYQNRERQLVELNQAQKALRQSQRKLQDIANSIPGLIYQFYVRPNGSWGMSYVSERSLDITGLDNRADDYLERFNAQVPDSEHRRFHEAVTKAIESGEVFDHEGRFIKPSGEIIWLHGMATPQRQGDVLFYNGVIMDVTRRKKAEDEQARLTAIVEQTSDFVGSAALDGRISYINKAGRRLLGLNELGDLPMLTIADCHPDWAFQLLQKEGNPQAFEKDVWQGETAVKNMQDGREIPVSQILILHRDSSGEARYMSTIMRDITERNRIEAELRKSEEKFRRIFDLSPIHMSITRLSDGLFYDVNQAFEKCLGYSRHETIGRTSKEMGLWTDTAERDRIIAAMTENDPFSQFETKLIRKDGKIINVLFSGAPIDINDEKMIIIIVMDITDIKRAEGEIRKSEKKFRLSIEKMYDGFILVDEKGYVTEWNTACERMLGYSRSEVIGRFIWEIQALVIASESFSPERATQVADFFHDGGDKKEEWIFNNLQSVVIVTKAGERRNIDYASFQVEDAGLRFFGAVLKDVTETRQAEKLLRESEERFRTVFNLAPYPFIITDFQGRHLFANKAFCQAIGYDESEVIGKTTFELGFVFLPDQTAREIFYDKGEINLVETMVTNKDGESFHIIYSSKIIELGKEHVILTSIIDISDRKRMEEDLRRNELELRSILRTAPVGICLVRDRVFLHVNDTMTEMFGYTREEFIGQTSRMIYESQEEYERIGRMVHFDGLKTNIFSTEARCRHKSGSLISIIVRFTTLDPSNEDAGYVAIMLDITESKRAEEALMQTNQFLGALIKSSPLPIVALDYNGLVTFWNPAAEHVLGWRADEVLGFPLPTITSEKKAEHDAIREHSMHGDGYTNIEVQRRRKDGSPIHLSVSTAPLRDAQGQITGLISFNVDITERKRAEEALKQTNQFLETLIQSSPLPILTLDTEGLVTFWNPAAEHVFGWRADEVLGFPHPAIPSEKKEEHDILRARAMYGGGSTNIEVVRRKKDGSLIHLSVSTAPLRDAQGQVNGLISFNIDITERKRAEEALRASEAALSEAQAIAHVGHWEYYPVTEELKGSEEYYRIFGDSHRADSTREGFYKTLHPDDVAPTMKAARAAYEQDIPYNVEHRIQPAPGIQRVVQSKGRAIRDDQGRPIRLFGTTLDITERKEIEDELRRLRNFLVNIIDSMPSVLIGVDAEGKVTQWNLEAERQTGFHRENALGKSLEEVFARLGTEMTAIHASIRERLTRQGQRKTYQLAGETRYEDLTVYPLITNGIEGAVIRLDDVTERVRLEEMMIQSEKMLSVGGLAAGMAHEINNPLGGMIQTAWVLQDRLTGDLPANLRVAQACGISMDVIKSYMERRDIPKLLNTMRDSGTRAAAIVQNMLSFARKSESSLQNCRIHEILDHTLDLAATDYNLKKTYDFKQIQIIREYADDVLWVRCELQKIQQVILNLLKNAAEAMQESRNHGQMTVAPRIVIRTVNEEKFIRIEVEDNGPGMTEEIKKRVFEPFFTTKPVGQGTGLGLSVSYFIITENHGGSMKVESRPGGGARFIIQLPV